MAIARMASSGRHDTPVPSGEIEEINSMNASEVGHLENSTKEQEDQNTKNHVATVCGSSIADSSQVGCSHLVAMCRLSS